jgi:hypothetical protein
MTSRRLCGKLRRCALVLSACCCVFFASATRADEVGSEPSSAAAAGIESVPETAALRETVDKAKYPWLSKETGKPVYLPLSPVEEIKRPRSKSQEHNADFGWLDGLAKFATWLIYALVAGALLAAIFWAVRSFAQKSWKLKSRVDGEAAARERRISTLAPEAAERYDDLLAAAQDAFDRGDYRYALIFYFSYLLVEMDKRRFVLLEKGKTNLVYWRELTEFPELRSIYRSTMKEFERVYFGGASITREEFDAIWSLHARFSELTREHDARGASRLGALASASQGTSAPVPTQLTLFIAVLALASCFGCLPEKNTWRSRYKSDVEQNDRESLNSATTYLKYCRSGAKWKVQTVNHWQMMEYGLANLVRGKDAVVWFDPPPRPGSPPFSDLRWLYAGEGTGERADRVAAAEAILRRYADATENDFDQFATTLTTPNFDAIKEDVARWLEGRPNRVFVIVGSGWDAYPYYLLDARQDLLDSGAADAEPRLLQECDGFLERFMKDVKGGRTPSFNFEGVDWTDLDSWADKELQKWPETSKDMFLALQAVNRAILASPKKHAAVLLWEYEESEYEEAGAVLPDGLKEAVILQFEQEQAAAPEEPGSSEESADSAPDVGELDVEEKWRLAFRWIRSEISVSEVSMGMYRREKESAGSPFPYRIGKFDDGTAWQTDERAWEPFFVTRIMPSAFGEWTKLEGGGKESGDIRHDPQSLIRTGKFSGDPKWTQGLPEEARLYEFCRLEPFGDTKVLLALGDVPLICERKVGQSRLLIVNSSSFLSNYGLTDPVNMELAARLTREIPPKSRVLVSLTNIPYFDFDASDDDLPPDDGPFSLKEATPYAVFIWNLVFLGACAVFWAYPVFGRPKRLLHERRNDFSRHINAYASELEKIGAREWAQEQIDAYRASDNLPEL